MTRYLHTMYRIVDLEKSRAFYEALGFEFRRELPIVRDGNHEATNTRPFASRLADDPTTSAPSTTTPIASSTHMRRTSRSGETGSTGTFSAGIGWQVPRLPGLGEVDLSRFVASPYAPATTASCRSNTRTGASRAISSC